MKERERGTQRKVLKKTGNNQIKGNTPCPDLKRLRVNRRGKEYEENQRHGVESKTTEKKHQIKKVWLRQAEGVEKDVSKKGERK